MYNLLDFLNFIYFFLVKKLNKKTEFLCKRYGNRNYNVINKQDFDIVYLLFCLVTISFITLIFSPLTACNSFTNDDFSAIEFLT